MLSKSAISRLQAILLIDILIISVAAAGYFYVSSLSGPSLSDSQVQLLDLRVTPAIAVVGDSLRVSVNVSNIGGVNGEYLAVLFLDGAQIQTQTVKLDAGAEQQIQFTITSQTEGTHTVSIGNLQASFVLAGKLGLSDLAINRTVAAVGEPIGITVKVTNKVAQTEPYSLTLLVNGSTVQTKTGQVDANQATNVLFEVVEQVEGTYQFSVGSLNGSFTITPAAPPAKPADFLVSKLIIDPDIAQPGMVVNVTATVSNMGEATGTYAVNFTVNGELKGTQTVELAGGESKTVSFSVTETAKGTYTIMVGNVTSSLSVQDPSTIQLVGMIVTPYEVWAGQTVNIIIRGTNTGSSTSALP
jgi:hypothetical protein